MNLSEVESGMVVRSRARILTPISKVALRSCISSFVPRTKRKRKNAPSLAEIKRVLNLVRRFLIVNHDEDAPLVAKLVLLGSILDHLPRQPGVGTEERVALVVGEETVPNRSDAHDEAGSGRGEDAAVVVRLRDGVEVEGADLLEGGGRVSEGEVEREEERTMSAVSQATFLPSLSVLGARIRFQRPPITPKPHQLPPLQPKESENAPSSDVILVLKTFSSPFATA